MQTEEYGPAEGRRDLARCLQRHNWSRSLCLVLAATWLAGPALAQGPIDKAPYAPFEFLIGTWEVSASDGSPPFQINRFRWGAGRAYILFSGSNLADGAEQPQFEGMLMWNGVTKKLDMLLATDLRYGLVQQQGTIAVASNGMAVRDIDAIFSNGVSRGAEPAAGPQGAVMKFRQTYRLVTPGKIATSVFRQVNGQWLTSHEGSEDWVMTRRAD